QHQEVIRAALTQEPRERNDAIDRLLGLSDYRNLLSGLSDANPRRSLKDSDVLLEAFAGQVSTALALAEKDRRERLQAALAAGVPEGQAPARTALALARQVREGLQALAAEAGLETAAPQAPAEAKELPGFEKAARAAISAMRSGLPDLRQQQE